MKLFEVSNGSRGESYVRVFVIADTPIAAKKLAKHQYEENGNYADILQVEMLCGDTTKDWASKVRDY